MQLRHCESSTWASENGKLGSDSDRQNGDRGMRERSLDSKEQRVNESEIMIDTYQDEVLPALPGPSQLRADRDGDFSRTAVSPRPVAADCISRTNGSRSISLGYWEYRMSDPYE